MWIVYCLSVLIRYLFYRLLPLNQCLYPPGQIQRLNDRLFAHSYLDLSRSQLQQKPGGLGQLTFLMFEIAVSLQAVNQEMATIGNIFLVLIPGALLLVAFGAWLVSSSALRPIHHLTRVIQQVTVKALDRRIAIGTTDVEFALTDSGI